MWCTRVLVIDVITIIDVVCNAKYIMSEVCENISDNTSPFAKNFCINKEESPSIFRKKIKILLQFSLC